MWNIINKFNFYHKVSIETKIHQNFNNRKQFSNICYAWWTIFYDSVLVKRSLKDDSSNSSDNKEVFTYREKNGFDSLSSCFYL